MTTSNGPTTAAGGDRAQIEAAAGGMLAVEPEVVRVLVEHMDRLQLQIEAEPWNTARWYDAVLSGGDLLPLQGSV